MGSGKARVKGVLLMAQPQVYTKVKKMMPIIPVLLVVIGSGLIAWGYIPIRLRAHRENVSMSTVGEYENKVQEYSSRHYDELIDKHIGPSPYREKTEALWDDWIESLESGHDEEEKKEKYLRYLQKDLEFTDKKSKEIDWENVAKDAYSKTMTALRKEYGENLTNRLMRTAFIGDRTLTFLGRNYFITRHDKYRWGFYLLLVGGAISVFLYGSKVKHILSGIFCALGYLGYIFIFGLYGLYVSMTIVHYVAGFWGVVIGFTILPATFFAAPFYALIAWGEWYPILVICGSFAVSYVLFAIGELLKPY